MSERIMQYYHIVWSDDMISSPEFMTLTVVWSNYIGAQEVTEWHVCCPIFDPIDFCGSCQSVYVMELSKVRANNGVNPSPITRSTHFLLNFGTYAY